MPDRKVWHQVPATGDIDPLMVPVSVSTGRHPWEIAGLCIFVIVGLALVSGAAPAPSSVNAALPAWFVVLWKGQLAVGAIVALVAVLLPQRTLGQLLLSFVIERTAMMWFGSATLVFPIVLAATGQSPALTAIGYATAYGLGGLGRAWQINRDLRRLHRAVRTDVT